MVRWEFATHGDDQDVFFYQMMMIILFPVIMIDLEPRVVNGIQASDYKHLYNQENFFVAKDGGGAEMSGLQVIDKVQNMRM